MREPMTRSASPARSGRQQERQLVEAVAAIAVHLHDEIDISRRQHPAVAGPAIPAARLGDDRGPGSSGAFRRRVVTAVIDDDDAFHPRRQIREAGHSQHLCHLVGDRLLLIQSRDDDRQRRPRVGLRYSRGACLLDDAPPQKLPLGRAEVLGRSVPCSRTQSR